MTSPTIVELRQYTLRGGRREELIRLFESTLIEPQNSAGAKVLATFRDLDDPDRFVWMRGFTDMDSRKEALSAFYDGAVWKTYRDAANATMLDSDNVLLLRPATATSGMSLLEHPRAPSNVIRVTIGYLGAADGQAYSRFFETRLRAQIEKHGANLLGSYVSEATPNNFRLPVREPENVFFMACPIRNSESRTRLHESASGFKRLAG